MDTIEKLRILKDIIKALESVVVAFSGGVDSSLVAKVCYDVLGDKALAVTARSETYPAYEYEEAKKDSKEIGIRHMTIDTSELGIKGFAENPPTGVTSVNQNYLGNSKKLPRKRGIKMLQMALISTMQVNIDPDSMPLRNLRFVVPLKESGLRKVDIREISKVPQTFQLGQTFIRLHVFQISLWTIHHRGKIDHCRSGGKLLEEYWTETIPCQTPRYYCTN